MGKNGAALRAAKMENTKYVFTKAQLEEHDRNLISRKKEQILADMQRQADEMNAKRAEELLNQKMKLADKVEQDYEDNFYSGYRFFCCKLLRVIINDFGFPTYKGFSNRTTRLMEAMMGEIELPTKEEVDEMCDKTFEEYGVRFYQQDKLEGGDTDAV